MKPRNILLLTIVLLSLSLTGCGSDPTTLPSAPPTTQALLPSETPIPLAAIVDGESISLASFEEELARFNDARGTDLAPSERHALVLGALIDRKLLALGARSSGYNIDESTIDQKIEALIEDLGNESSFQSWLERNHYTPESFRSALQEESLASIMVEMIVADVSRLDLHANARHILVATEEQALRIRGQILAGDDFSELAVAHSLDLSTRPAGGDLGWLSKGTLTIPEIEEIIFSLQPGELSDVVRSELGYHLIELIALEERPLSRQQLEIRRDEAIEIWLKARREKSEIEIFVDP